MSSSKSTSSIVAVVGVILAFTALLLTIPVLAILSDLKGSDAAGNAMAQGFAALGLFAPFALDYQKHRIKKLKKQQSTS